MPVIPTAKDQWYVVHVLSGQENKVMRNINRRIESEEMGEYIFEALMPTERVSEVKGGKKRESTRKFYPGYIIVNMNLLTEENKLVDKTWYFIQETNGIIGFAGSKGRGAQTVLPIPMKSAEVESMLAQIKEREEGAVPKITFELGETIKVNDGPFEGQDGIVEEIDPDEGKLMVSVDIFGRATPVELQYWQVTRE